MTDEILLTAAKLREQVRVRLDGEQLHRKHTGLVDGEFHASSLSFLESSIRRSELEGVDTLDDTTLGRELLTNYASRTANTALNEGNAAKLSHHVGVTSQDLDASSLTLPARILERLVNNEQLTTILAAGAPNSGKTNTVWLLSQLVDSWHDDLLTISNARAEIVDVRTTTAHDLTLSLLEHRDRPKVVVIDEGSTHFDTRTNRYEIASQWSPLLKRMSKLGVEMVCVIGHTGKDVDPEVKRLTNLGLFKESPKEAGFYAEWPADDDRPDDRLFGGDLSELEPTAVEYDPDEPAPWAWNLRADLFAKDHDWPELLEEILDRGPADSS